MEKSETYPKTEDIKTLQDVLKDIDKKMVFKIFDKEKAPDIYDTVFTLAHQMDRMKQYIKVITNRIIEL